MELLIERNLTLNLKFKKREVKLTFPEPTIYNLLKFGQIIKEGKYYEGIKFIIPDINEKDFISNPVGIIEAVKQLIYGEQKKKSGSDIENDEEGFFPSSLDIIGNRYGILPTELIKKITFSQMLIIVKGYEWNINIQNGKDVDNAFILNEFTEESQEDKEKIAKLLNRHKKT